MPTLLIASNNPGKLREIRALLNDLPIDLALPADLGIHLDVDETGSSYAENAALKARAFCQASGLPALADDSGLEVDALNGEPGIRSARYAPIEHPSDADLRAYLLSCLREKPKPWKAHFHSSVVLAAPDGRLFQSEGRCLGQVVEVERGDQGFGYDPIFLMDETGCTMSELDMEDKNRFSHRARAVTAAIPAIKQLLGL